MRQFDIHRMGGQRLVVVLQADVVGDLNVVVVAPLYRAAEWESPARHLHPRLTFAGDDYILVVNHLGAVAKAALGDRIGSVPQHRHDIVAALDFLFTGI